jgi:hypothetical protein
MKQAKYQCVESPKVIVYPSVKGSEETKTRRSHGDIHHCLRWLGANLKERPKIFGQAFAEYFRAGSLYKLYNEVRHPMLIRKLAEFRRQGFRVANVKPDTLFFYFQSVKRDSQ